MKTSDETIIKKCLEGDREAFGELVNRYKDVVYGIAYHHIGDFAEAEDATQDVFLQAYLRLHQLKEHAKFLPWLKRITVNICNRHLLTRNYHGAALAKWSWTAKASALNPEEIYEKEALRKQVKDAITSLSEKNRLTLTLYYIDGLTCQQVADSLEVPLGTVKRRLHVARKQLKEAMTVVDEGFEQNKLQEGFTEKTLQRFDEIANLTRKNLWGLLHLVWERDWVIALKGANPRVRDHILNQFEPAKSEELKSKLSQLGELSEETISQAQQVVLNMMNSLGKFADSIDFDWHLELLDDDGMTELTKHLQQQDILEAHPPGLRGTADRFLRQMPPKQAEELTTQLDEWGNRRKAAEKMAAEISEKLLGIDEAAKKGIEPPPLERFDDILNADDQTIAMLYCNIDHLHLATALKGASPQIRKRVFSVIDATNRKVSVVYPQAMKGGNELKRKLAEMEEPSQDAIREAQERAVQVAQRMKNFIRDPFHLYMDNLNPSQAEELSKQMADRELSDALAHNSRNGFEMFVKKLPADKAEAVRKLWYEERERINRARLRIVEEIKGLVESGKVQSREPLAKTTRL